MLTPIEQAPSLVLDPARQQMTPAVPVQPQPLPPLSDTPVQNAGQTNQQSNQSNKGQGSEVAYEQKEQAETAQRLRAAWAYLQQLKSQVAQALSGGNAIYAKRIALEAADVAADIETISMQIPIGNNSSNTVAQTNAWLPPSFNDPDSGNASTASSSTVVSSSLTSPSLSSTTVSSSSSSQSQGGTLIDLARQGLGTAKDVVDQASSLPHYSVADRATVDSSMRKVLEAMANVESLASKLSSKSEGNQTSYSTRIDVSA